MGSAPIAQVGSALDGDLIEWLQMVDIHLPTTDGQELVLSRYTQPEKDLQILLQQLKLHLPEQPPPKIQSYAIPTP